MEHLYIAIWILEPHDEYVCVASHVNFNINEPDI